MGEVITDSLFTFLFVRNELINLSTNRMIMIFLRGVRFNVSGTRAGEEKLGG